MWAKPGVARWFCGIAVITSALHADGPGFNPQWNHKSSFDAKNVLDQRWIMNFDNFFFFKDKNMVSFSSESLYSNLNVYDYLKTESK